tara:strand:- start:140 stop:796 length:657 start_codon:yes stop_codon:yes gene_type:complete
MRYEVKIPLSFDNLNIFEKWLLNQKNINKIYKPRIISSIYYDDINLGFANDNLIGISNRIKIRLRSYNLSENFNYEFKIKKNKIGTKIIIPSKKNINEIDLKKILSVSNKEIIDNSFAKEINSILINKKLLPIIKVTYKRKYYSFKNSVRITFDYPSTYFNYSNMNGINHDHINVLEIKFHPDDYYFAQNLIHNSPFIPKRFSKYLRALSFTGSAVYL